MVILDESTPHIEKALQISKLIKIPVLLDVAELDLLFSQIENAYLFFAQGIYNKGEAYCSKELFIHNYGLYIDSLKNGIAPHQKVYQAQFSLILSSTIEILYSLSLHSEKELVRSRKPIIQIQNNLIQYSQEDEQFRSMVLTQDSISWGLQFSYPQLFQDPQTKEVISVNNSDTFPNSALFKFIQQCIRKNTLPTYFLVNGKQVNSSIRLGKNCFFWIHNHPQLKEKKIQIKMFHES